MVQVLLKFGLNLARFNLEEETSSLFLLFDDDDGDDDVGIIEHENDVPPFGKKKSRENFRDGPLSPFFSSP